MDKMLTQWLVNREDGSQILIDLWWTMDHDPVLEQVVVAERQTKGDTWGVPVDAEKA